MAAVFCRKRMDARSANFALTVNELDPFAWHFQAQATQGGDKVRAIATACNFVNIFTAARSCQQCGDYAQVSRVIRTDEPGGCNISRVFCEYLGGLVVCSVQPVAFCAAHFAEPLASSHWRTSSQRQAVVLLPSLTGATKCPVLTQRHSVAGAMGMIAGISWDCRM